MNHLIYKIGSEKVRIEVAYQCDISQENYDEANKDTTYIFGECPIKLNQALNEARKYGHGVLHIVNGSKVVRCVPF